ncbi:MULTISPECIES: hypothetical protein [Sinorhizobium]|uniref:hypothetical protein n=1 Tax=Sinorhizobium TaxID=28105 RepID=UPI000BE7DEFE|nr:MULTISPECIES: hypothetical protein [Sinorhizobium]PDT50848.1 hypothetical protein CO664_24080 [Sinorhizobium sp. NG07B]POH24968.1 hypothetical protein ATY30_28385 [Sinorhizobium americanum]
MSDAELEILKLLHAAEGQRTKIEGALSQIPLFAQPHFRLSSRVKSPKRAYDKLSRIRLEFPNKSALDIPDLIGFRIVTLFTSSVIEALDNILDAIEHKNAFNGNSPFKKAEPNLILYTARPESDPLSFKSVLESWAQSRNLTASSCKTYGLETLYSSVHLLASCEVDIENFDGTKQRSAIPVEIQVRTAMEDVWGQISHLTSYSNSDRKPSVGKHLNALKQLIDGCSLYAENIKGEAELVALIGKDAREGPRARGDSGLSKLEGLPRDVTEAFETAVSIRRSAAQSDDSSEGFDDAADKFLAIEQQLRLLDIRADQQRDAIYLVQMERAFCLMYSDSIASNDEALRLYSALARADDRNALCRLRLGQALRRRDNHERARDTYIQAIRILDEKKDNKTQNPDSLKSVIKNELAFSYWSIAQREPDPDKHRAAVCDAVYASRDALKLGESSGVETVELLGAQNNLLYYAWEYLNEFGESILEREEMARLIARMSPNSIAALLPSHKQDAVLDTYLRISIYLERWEEVRKVSVQIIDIIRKKVQRRSGIVGDPDRSVLQKHLTEDELDTYWYASEALATLAIKSRKKGGRAKPTTGKPRNQKRPSGEK